MARWRLAANRASSSGRSKTFNESNAAGLHNRDPCRQHQRASTWKSRALMLMVLRCQRGQSRRWNRQGRGSRPMAITRKQEVRALSVDERELVEKSHHPVLQELSDEGLSDLVKLMRERREKATTSGEPTSPRNARERCPDGVRIHQRPMKAPSSRWPFSRWRCAGSTTNSNAAVGWSRVSLWSRAPGEPWR